jgi:hypothetical protein
VPSQLLTEKVAVHVYSSHLEVLCGGERVERMERLHGKGQAAINYRHVIHSLVKKPGAFAHYRFQASLFPRLIFRVAYDELKERQAATADREYLRLLHLAATISEDWVAEALREMVERGQRISRGAVEEFLNARVGQPQSGVPALAVPEVSLASYDQLLAGEEVAA